MIRIIDARTQNPFDALKGRIIHRDDQTEKIVKGIIEDVRTRGDEALLENARKYDAPGLQSIEVTQKEILISPLSLSPDEKLALDCAGSRVAGFHVDQLVHFTGTDWPRGGKEVTGARYWRRLRTDLGQRILPLSSVGVYVPGGQACYPSSVFMNAMPAKVAGVKEIVVATPARGDGSLHPAVLYPLLHVDKAFKIGGAAAIAAMALGTESVPRVDKIVGPGNRFVNEAKRQLWGTVGLDGYAGPSEVCVLADESTNARFAAADLLTQIEHAPDNCGFLVCTDEAKLKEILHEVDRQATGTPREETLRKALAGDSIAFLARDLPQAIEIVDAIAPEHLSIATKDPERAMEKVRNAGCILLGDWSPESSGDFCAGPSHTLPTSGSARFGSPVSVLDFLKVQSVIQLTKEELKDLSPTIETFAEMEGFPAHGNGVRVRFEGP